MRRRLAGGIDALVGAHVTMRERCDVEHAAGRTTGACARSGAACDGERDASSSSPVALTVLQSTCRSHRRRSGSAPVGRTITSPFPRLSRLRRRNTCRTHSFLNYGNRPVKCAYRWMATHPTTNKSTSTTAWRSAAGDVHQRRSFERFLSPTRISRILGREIVLTDSGEHVRRCGPDASEPLGRGRRTTPS